MRILKEKGYHLDWVGGGELWDDITNAIKENGLSDNISMHGHQRDVRSYLSQACVFLLPSFREGLSIATVEAQAAGLPCVISDTIPREVDCGLCRFVPLDSSPEEWARQIDVLATGEELLHVDLERLKKYDAKSTCNEVMELYK
jgi:glycosyltransferase EpsF